MLAKLSFSLMLNATVSLMARHRVYTTLLLYYLVGIGLKLGANIDCLPPCLFSSLLDIECWGCGLTRATIACTMLNFKAAYELNPLIFLVLPVLISCILKAWYAELKRLSELQI